MTLPALITVRATVRDASGPVAGRVVFARSAILFPASSSDQNYLIPEEVEVEVGADGLLAQQLYAGNDPAASPTGWTWEVRPHFRHWHTPFSIVVPYDAADGEVNLNQLAPVPPDGTGDLYALVNHTHAGGGSVTLGAVVAQTTFGLSSASGVLDTVSRSDHKHCTPATPTAADVGADASGTATAAVSAHVAAADPHPQYLTSAEGGAAYSPVGALAASNNLSDLSSVATALTNLGTAPVVVLGSADEIPVGTPAGAVIVRTAT